MVVRLLGGGVGRCKKVAEVEPGKPASKQGFCTASAPVAALTPFMIDSKLQD